METALEQSPTPVPVGPPEDQAELEIWPNGIPVVQLAEFLKDKGGFPLALQAEMTRQKFNCQMEDLPRLLLAVQTVKAARQGLAFDLLSTLSENLQQDPSGTVTLTSMVSDLCNIAAGR